MKKEKKAILIAFVLGDGYIKSQRNSCCSLKFCHCKQQLEYLQYKINLLHSLMGGKKPIIREYLCKSNKGNFLQVRSEKSHRYFKVLRRWLYPNKYNINYLKYLTPKALAIWFMDDGSSIVNNRYNTKISARTNLHIYTTKEIAEQVCLYFKNFWDIKWTTFKESGGTYSIRCFHKEGKKFHDLIHPYIIPSMMYKQRFYYNTSAQPLSNKGDDIV